MKLVEFFFFFTLRAPFIRSLVRGFISISCITMYSPCAT